MTSGSSATTVNPLVNTISSSVVGSKLMISTVLASNSILIMAIIKVIKKSIRSLLRISRPIRLRVFLVGLLGALLLKQSVPLTMQITHCAEPLFSLHTPFTRCAAYFTGLERAAFGSTQSFPHGFSHTIGIEPQQPKLLFDLANFLIPAQGDQLFDEIMDKL